MCKTRYEQWVCVTSMVSVAASVDYNGCILLQTQQQTCHNLSMSHVLGQGQQKSQKRCKSKTVWTYSTWTALKNKFIQAKQVKTPDGVEHRCAGSFKNKPGNIFLIVNKDETKTNNELLLFPVYPQPDIIFPCAIELLCFPKIIKIHQLQMNTMKQSAMHPPAALNTC